MRHATVFTIVVLIISLGALPIVFALPDVIITPTPTPRPIRDIDIEVLTEPAMGALFEIGDVFTGRHHEGFSIWTEQARFWQPGDFFDAGSLDTRIIFDNTLAIEPFYFWRSSHIAHITGDDGEPIGTFLDTPIYISVSTADLALGPHTLTVEIETPHREVFSQTWEFVIRERATPRAPIPTELAQTAEYLFANPNPTPAYIVKLPTEATSAIDPFLYLEEGICLVIDDEMPVPLEDREDLFRSGMGDNITFAIDSDPLSSEQMRSAPSDSPGHLFICLDTDHLTPGLHIAKIQFRVDETPYSYTWAFAVD
jgi:hypothetical protein